MPRAGMCWLVLPQSQSSYQPRTHTQRLSNYGYLDGPREVATSSELLLDPVPELDPELAGRKNLKMDLSHTHKATTIVLTGS